MSPTDDVGLIVRAQAGDLRAFEQLLHALEPPLRRYLGRVVGARPVPDDALQETFVRIGAGWAGCAIQRCSAPGRIASRRVKRSASCAESAAEDAGASEAELNMVQAAFTDPATRLDLESTLRRISPLARTVLAAHYFEGLTLEEVAAVVEAPLGTVKSRLASGLKQARTLMEPAE